MYAFVYSNSEKSAGRAERGDETKVLFCFLEGDALLL